VGHLAKALLAELRPHLSLLPAVRRQRDAQTQQVTEQRRAEDPGHGHFGPASARCHRDLMGYQLCSMATSGYFHGAKKGI